MALARKKFLSNGYYNHLMEGLLGLFQENTGAEPVIFDSGCGEGYYTAGIFHGLTAKGKKPKMAGVDLSKHSLRWAAKRAPEVAFAVASSYHLPVADATVDLLLNCFSPLAIEEFHRVIKPGGKFFYVVPAPQHLWELKAVLYPTPYLNEEKQIPYDGFCYQEIRRVERRIHLPDQETIRNLFQMTPYYWKTPLEGKKKLEQLSTLDVQTAFDIHVFTREN